MITLRGGEECAAMASGVEKPVREPAHPACVAHLVVLLAEPEVIAANAGLDGFTDDVCGQHAARRVLVDRGVARDEPGELRGAADQADVDRRRPTLPFEHGP